MFGKKSTDYTPPAQLPGRNDPCHCGSGKKYKKCHEDKDAAAKHTLLEKKWQEGEQIVAKAAAEAPENQSTGESEQSPKPRGAKAPRPAPHKRNTMTVPKFNMPRKTGGGGA